MAYVFLIWASIAMYPSKPVMAGSYCKPLKSQLITALKSGYAYLATAIDSRGIVLVFFINREGFFQIVGVDDNQSACVLVQGSEWRFAMERKI